MKYRVSAELPLDAATWFIERDCSAYRSLMAKVLGLALYECVDSWRDDEAGGIVSIKLMAQPEASWMPKQLAAHVPSGLHFFDTVRYDPAGLQAPPYELQTTMHVPALGSKVKSIATVRIEEMGPGRCLHVIEGELVIHMFGLGRVAERLVRRSVEQMMRLLPAVCDRWVAFRTQMLAQPDGAKRLLAGRPDLSHVPWIAETCRRMLDGPARDSPQASLRLLTPAGVEEQQQQQQQQRLAELLPAGQAQHDEKLQVAPSEALTSYFSAQGSLSFGGSTSLELRPAGSAAAALRPAPPERPLEASGRAASLVPMPSPFASAAAQSQPLGRIPEAGVLLEHDASQAWLHYWDSAPSVPALHTPAASAVLTLARVSTMRVKHQRGKQATKPAAANGVGTSTRRRWWRCCWQEHPVAPGEA